MRLGGTKGFIQPGHKPGGLIKGMSAKGRMITDVLTAPIAGAYYYEDLAALQWAPKPVSERYLAQPISPGFKAVRQVAEGVSVGLVLDGEKIVWGDCIAVCYSSKAGREPVFRAESAMDTIKKMAAPVLRGKRVGAFRDMVAEIEELREKNGEPLHKAIQYGLSQALLSSVAKNEGLTMAEVVAQEYDLPTPSKPVPVHAQSGHDLYDGADKMITRRVDSLPHMLVDDIEGQLGDGGVKLIQYIQWLRERIDELGDDGYQPTIHLDMHGGLGIVFSQQMGKILGFLYSLANAAKPYAIRIEDPVSMTSREEQIKAMAQLMGYAQRRKVGVQIVADEWANTLEDIEAFCDAQAADMIQIKMPDLGGIQNSIEAVLRCKESGVGTFLGGSCAETINSAKISVQIALATQPEIVMAKPGMGIDEAVILTQNEMVRTLAWINNRNKD